MKISDNEDIKFSEKSNIEYLSINSITENEFADLYIINEIMDEINNDYLEEMSSIFKINSSKLYNINSDENKFMDIDLYEQISDLNLDNTNAGIITNQKKCPITLMTYDDLQIIVVDKTKDIIGLMKIGVHQTVYKLIKNVIATMNKKYNSNPMDIEVYILTNNNGLKVVDDDVIGLLETSFVNVANSINKEDSQIDLIKINVSLLLEVGIKYENVKIYKNLDEYDFKNIRTFLQIK